MTDKHLILTTASSRDEANLIASELVSRRLVACVNILGPVASVYQWQGEVEHSEELVILIKSTESRVLPIQETVRELHSYQVPELISFRVESGLDSYLDWITACVRK